MDTQDPTRTQAQGHEGHGVLVCHKCGWHFPNPHPSAKHRRAHKKICGTIEGYNVFLVSEGQTHFDPSDAEHVSDDDHTRQGPNALDNGNNDNVSGGIGEYLIRSGDDVFSDAVAEFSDGGLSPGVKEHLRDSLGTDIDMEIIRREYPEFSASSDRNVADESRLIVESRNDGRVQNPEVLQSERVEDGIMLALQGQLSSSTRNPFSSSIEDFDIEELTMVHSNDCFGLTSDSKPRKSEARPDELLENEIYDGEKDEIKSDRDFVEIVVSSNNAVGEMCEAVSKIAVSDAVNPNYQGADGAFNLKEKNSAEFPYVIPRDDFPLEANSAMSSTDASLSGIQVESAHMIELATSSDVKMLQEREKGSVNAFTPQSGYEDHEAVVSRTSFSLHSLKELEQVRDDLKYTVTEEIDSLIDRGQLREKREVLSRDEGMHTFDSNVNKEQVNCELLAEEMHTEESIEVLPGMFKVESNKRSYDSSMNAMKTEVNESPMVHFSEEQASDGVPKTSQHISLSDGCFMAKSNENPTDASFGSATIENGTGIGMKSLQPCNLNSEIKPSSVYKSSLNDTQFTERPIVKNTTPASSFESLILSEVETDGSARIPLSGAQEGIKYGEINSNGRSKEDCNRFSGTTAETYQVQDGKLLLKAAEGLGRDHSSDTSLNIEPSAQHASAAEDEEPAETRSGTGDNDIKLASSAIYTSTDPGCRCDSLKANWGSASVLSVQSDAQAAIEERALPSTEADKSNLKAPEAAASESQQYGKAEMFEPPSFMTLVEPGHAIGLKPAASAVQTESNKELPNSTSSRAGWFPTLTHVTNESQGRKRNEEIIAKVTNRGASKQQYTPLKTLLGEAAAHSSKPKSSKSEKNSANQKNGKVPEDNDSGSTTVTPILGPELPAAAQTPAKGEGAKERNSPAKYPANNIKREKKKTKSRPYWIPFVCCSSVDTR